MKVKLFCLSANGKRSITLSIGLLFSLLGFESFSQQMGLPFTKYISSEEYNYGMMNSAIVQDSRGFMYFANNWGLLEFDGSKWNTYAVRTGSNVRDVAISKEGKIYVAAQGDFGFFTADETGNLIYTSLAASLTEKDLHLDEVWRVFIGKKEIYFCASNNIFIYYNDSLVEVIPIDPTIHFYYLNNRLYLQTEGKGLSYLSNGKFEEHTGTRNIHNKEVVALLRGIDNKFLLVSANNGIFDEQGERDKSLMIDSKPLKNATINTATRLRNGNLAFGTQNDGLFIFNDTGKLIAHLTKGSGLNYRVVLSILEDIHGNLWLGHENGLTIVELSMPFSYINEEMGLPGSGFDAYYSGNEVFLASNNGLFRGKIDDFGTKFRGVENSLEKAFFVNEFNGKILLGHHYGSYEVNNNTAIEINSRIGTWVYLKVNSDVNKLVAGTYDGLQLLTYENSKWNFTSDIKGFGESSRVMEVDNNGDIWMTHGYKGVFRLKLNTELDSVISVVYYGANEGLPANVLINVFKIENELIFTTTDGPYVFDYANNKFVLDSVLSQYPNLREPLNFLADDAKGNIYFLTRNHMGVLEKKSDGSYEINSNIFNKVHSRLNNYLPNISVLNSSNILFGAREGFVVYNSNTENYFEDSFNSYIRSVSVTADTDSVIFHGNFKVGNNIVNHQPEQLVPVLPYKNNSIRFTYTADYMNDFEQTEYQYMLEGYEENWSQWSSLAEKEYTNLSQGNYTFRVKAKNINNVESSETYYAFEILAPWYLSTAAYGAYVVVITAFLLFSFLFIDRKYRASIKSYEKKKQQEVDEIDNKLKSVTQETAEKIEKLKSEKLQSEVEIKNLELASSTMNLINKNGFINGIKGDLTIISKKSFSPEVKKELIKITREIDKNISHDDDWKQFAFHFNKVHGDFTTRITSDFEHLSAQDLRLCSYLRLNLSTKEIAQLLNISVRGVEIGRYRLRKKLALSRSDNLSEFILNF